MVGHFYMVAGGAIFCVLCTYAMRPFSYIVGQFNVLWHSMGGIVDKTFLFKMEVSCHIR